MNQLKVVNCNEQFKEPNKKNQTMERKWIKLMKIWCIWFKNLEKELQNKNKSKDLILETNKKLKDGRWRTYHSEKER